MIPIKSDINTVVCIEGRVSLSDGFGLNLGQTFMTTAFLKKDGQFSLHLFVLDVLEFGISIFNKTIQPFILRYEPYSHRYPSVHEHIDMWVDKCMQMYGIHANSLPV